MARLIKSQINILVADDDDDDCLLVEMAFKEALPDAHVSFVADGEMIFDYLHQCKPWSKQAENVCPDLIVLDLNMPRMDGREVLKRIKADERYKRIPVVVLSTSMEMRDIDLAYRLGASTYLRKPNNFAGLVKLVAVLGAYWFQAAELPDHDFHPPSDLPIKPKLKTTVLVVDDSSFARKVLTKILNLAGHNVLEAVDGESALDLYVTQKPELVLLDLVLSSLSGREVLEKLLEIDSSARIVITTVDVRQITSDEMVGRGAMGVLYKPFDSKSTLDLVDTAMKEPPLDKIE